jgi:hypothetical protein
VKEEGEPTPRGRVRIEEFGCLCYEVVERSTVDLSFEVKPELSGSKVGSFKVGDLRDK